MVITKFDNVTQAMKKSYMISIISARNKGKINELNLRRPIILVLSKLKKKITTFKKTNNFIICLCKQNND